MDIKNLFVGVNPSANKSNGQSDKNTVQANAERATDTDTKPASQEKVTLTLTASRFTQAQMTMNTQPEVNRERVAEIRKAIAEGSYKIDAGRIASRMMKFESALFVK
jgi:negative regulator of flagellin synthesis FlgM